MADEQQQEQQPPPQAPAYAGQVSGGGGPGNALNERTYHEVEYLKRNLGPILVAALAEICIRRPADPIEYLGHWLLRWRYNEELKRRDVQNALEVVRRKTWNDGTNAEMNQQQTALYLNTGGQDVPPAPETFGEGFIPNHPYAAPGYGGPLTAEQLNSVIPVDAAVPQPLPDSAYPNPEGLLPEGAPPEDMAAGGGGTSGQEQPQRPSLEQQPKRPSQDQDANRLSAAPEQPKRPSMEQPKRPSMEQPKRPSMEQPKRPSLEQPKRPSLEQPKRPSLEPQQPQATEQGTEQGKRESGEKRASLGAGPPAEQPPVE